jgi:sulfonate transport system substrate-binding protein
VTYVPGTNSHWVLFKALQQVGLTLHDVNSTFFPPGVNAQALLAMGRLDAAVSIDPTLTVFVTSGARQLASGAAVGAENPLYYIASEEAIATRSQAIAAFVGRLARHVAWARANPEARAAAVAALLHIPLNVALAAERNRPGALRRIDDGLVQNNQRIADAFAADHTIPAPLDVRSTFTRQFNSAVPDAV